jgi:hypothetical protein
MNLIHYSEKPLTNIYGVSQIELPEMKPHGLWVSVEGEGDWPSWCQANKFNLDRFEVHTKINLIPKANVLLIRGPSQLKQFHEKYKWSYYEYICYPHWHIVATEYDGIIIAPYLWSCRLDIKMTLYYAWDCASGCIWNPTCIDSLEVLEKEIQHEKESCQEEGCQEKETSQEKET